MEVLDIKPLADLVSEATIKVCWVSSEPNPNGTVITREVGKEIAASLPGAPVAGFFDKETGDFAEHSRRVAFEDGEFSIEDMTKPYGFVDPYSKPWYQDFEENGETKTYLMCKCYLWTRQYPEASLALDKSQSMELSEKDMQGYYQGEVFVFTNATIDKLCILGDDYAPCFSGAKILSTYAKQYKTLAEKLEITLERGYYVMNDQLVTKPENVENVENTELSKTPSLQYAFQLGRDLTEAIAIQLSNRGADRYTIKGVYAENGVMFAILQDNQSLEFVSCSVSITPADTIELGAEMTAVKQTWAVKTPLAPVPPTPLTDAPEQKDVPIKSAAAYSEAEISKTKKESVPTLPADISEPIVSEIEKVSISETVTDLDLAIEIANQATKIAELEKILAKYKAEEAKKAELEKEELITSYAEVLTAEEIAPIKEKIAEYSLEQVESKCAIMYSRKALTTTPNQFQVNIANWSKDNDVNAMVTLPDFMQQALEYDKQRQIIL